MIEEALKGVSGGESISVEEIQSMIDEAIAKVDGGLTEAEVQALIDAAIADIETSGGCSGNVGSTFAVVGSGMALAAAAAVAASGTGVPFSRVGPCS